MQLPYPGEARRLLNDSLLYSLAMYIRLSFKVIGQLLIAGFLGPILYGLKNIFSLVLEYEYFSHAGTFSAMDREVPYYRGAGRFEEADRIVATTFGLNLLYGLLACSLLLVFSVYLRNTNWDPIYADFALFMGFYIVLEKIIMFYRYLFVIDRSFTVLSKMEIVHSLAMTTASVIFVFYAGLRGLFLGLLIGDLVCVGYILKKVKRLPPVRVSFDLIWNLICIGFPIMVIGLMLMLLRSADRIVIAAMLSREALGYYGVATVVGGLVYIISEAIRSVFYPRLLEDLGRSKDSQRIKHYLVEPTVLAAYFMPFLLAVLYFGIHIPIKYFLSQFIPSIDVAQLLIIGLFFVPLFRMPLSICLALNRQLSIAFLSLVACIVNLVLNYWFIRFGWGIQGVAVATGVSYLVFTSIIISYALAQFAAGFYEQVRFFSLIYLPFIYTIVIVFLVDSLSAFPITSIWDDLILSLGRICLFSLLFASSFVFIRRHSALRKLVCALPSLRRAFPSLSWMVR